jgi:hypothetical protein
LRASRSAWTDCLAFETAQASLKVRAISRRRRFGLSIAGDPMPPCSARAQRRRPYPEPWTNAPSSAIPGSWPNTCRAAEHSPAYERSKYPTQKPASNKIKSRTVTVSTRFPLCCTQCPGMDDPRGEGYWHAMRACARTTNGRVFSWRAINGQLIRNALALGKEQAWHKQQKRRSNPAFCLHDRDSS